MHVYFKGSTPVDLVKDVEGAVVYSRNLLGLPNNSRDVDLWYEVIKNKNQLPSNLAEGANYAVQYDIEVIEYPEGAVPMADKYQSILMMYGKSPSIPLMDNYDDNVSDVKTWTLGTKRQRQQKFVFSSGYDLFAYPFKVKLSDGTEKVEPIRFTNLKFGYGDTYTGYTPMPEDLTGGATTNLGGVFS